MRRFIINPPVFYGSIFLILLFLALGVVIPGQAEDIFLRLRAGIFTNFGWLFLLSAAIFLISSLILALGKYGDLKLGPDDSEPEFRYLSWIAMLFAAGMGIGLMYFSVGEPIMHYAAPPEAEPLSIAAQREAMSITFFHWGLHAWAIYAVVGLSLGYFGYRYNLPLTIRSGLYPILKDRINGPIGHAVDIFAICGTVFGLATSLGFGVRQINAGLEYLFGIGMHVMVQISLVAVITVIATASVVSGLHKGLRILSELNLLIAIGLMLFVLALGPTVYLLRDFVQNIGLYLDSILLRTFNSYAYEPTPWLDAWTLFYWAWWISWSPFVGMFIARISRGRTVREFVIAVLFIPTCFTFFWMTVFGNTAIFFDQGIAAGQISAAVNSNISVALFQFLEYLPFSTFSCVLAIVLVVIFFVTSADSGAMVMDTIAAAGETQTTTLQRVFWCAITGGVAIVLLLAGGLGALQSATIAAALPFSIVMLILVFGLFKGMRADYAQQRAGKLGRRRRAYPVAGLPWQRRLALALSTPTEDEIRRFIDDTVQTALEAVATELNQRGRPATLKAGDGTVCLCSRAEGMRDFVYGVRPAAHKLPAFNPYDAVSAEVRHEAQTYFADGSQGYDIMGMSRDEIIGDVLHQFERYMALSVSNEVTLVVKAPEHG